MTQRIRFRLLICGLLLVSGGCSAGERVMPPLPTEFVFPTATSTVSSVPTDTPFFVPEASDEKQMPTFKPTVSRTSTLVTVMMPSAVSTRQPSLTPSATITNTATPSATPDFSQPLSIDFEAVISLPLEVRTPLRAALEAERPLLPGGDAFTVSAYRERDGWMKITLVPSELIEAQWQQVEQYDDQSLIVFAQRQPDRHWIAVWSESAAFAQWLSDIPPDFANMTEELPALAGEYRFPWPADRTWWAVNGWHDGNALDFQPALEGAGSSILAAENGRLREVCRDGFQSLLMIEHADGHRTYYLHVQLAMSARRLLLDQDVQRGQYLGELVQSTRFNWACGYGYSRHLHFIVDDRTLVINGFSLEAIAANASCCAHPPRYVSINERIDISE